MTWNDFSASQLTGCEVEATVRLAPGDPTSRWEIAVTRPEGLGVSTLTFPRAGGLRRQENERLAVPHGIGYLLPNPRAVLGKGEGRAWQTAWEYPRWFTLQCVAYYQDGGNGFYAACDDNAARRKRFAFFGSTEGDVDFHITHLPVDPANQEPRYVLPYGVRLGVFQGDWLTAAMRYREWGTKQPWAQKSRLHGGLVPKWVLNTGLWVWNRGRSPGVLPPAAALGAELGLPVNVLWHWWHGCPYDIGFPEYLPPREGTEPFRKAVAAAHEKGVRMLVYMNQRAWGMSTKSWKEEGAERFAVKGPDGKVKPEVYNTFTKKALASMCMGTSFWRNKYAGIAVEAFKELKIDGIYMDQACDAQRCYDPNHGHPVGGGTSWVEGFREMTGDIRRRCNGERPIVLAGEGCGEAWMPYLDLMLTLDVSRERYRPLHDVQEVIPFFQAVYHPYAATFGNYSSLSMPPYDDLWPAEFAPKEPLKLLDAKFSRQFRLEQARAFVWGQQPMLANFVERQSAERGESQAFALRLAKIRHRTREYLQYGEFLRPPKLDVPSVESDFSRLSIYAGQGSRLTSYRKSHPAVLAGAWRSKNDNVAIALANVTEEPITLSMPIDTHAYRLPDRPKVFRIDESGRRAIDRMGNLDSEPLEVELPGYGACVVELVGE